MYGFKRRTQQDYERKHQVARTKNEMSVRVWTEEKLNWIIESAKTTKDRRDILKAFNERFNKKP